MQVILPWPPHELSPNARVHWAKKNRIAQDYKTRCWWAAKEAKVVAPEGDTIVVNVTFVKPDRRR